MPGTATTNSSLAAVAPRIGAPVQAAVAHGSACPFSPLLTLGLARHPSRCRPMGRHAHSGRFCPMSRRAHPSRRHLRSMQSSHPRQNHCEVRRSGASGRIQAITRLSDLGKRCWFWPSTRPTPRNLRTSCQKFHDGAEQGPSAATNSPRQARKPPPKWPSEQWRELRNGFASRDLPTGRSDHRSVHPIPSVPNKRKKPRALTSSARGQAFCRQGRFCR